LAFIPGCIDGGKRPAAASSKIRIWRWVTNICVGIPRSPSAISAGTIEGSVWRNPFTSANCCFCGS
jgi:hypothetical protein